MNQIIRRNTSAFDMCEGQKGAMWNSEGNPAAQSIPNDTVAFWRHDVIALEISWTEESSMKCFSFERSFFRTKHGILPREF